MYMYAVLVQCIYSRRHNKVSIPFLLPFRFLVVLPFFLGARNSTQTDCRGSDATCKQGLQTNSWSSNRIRDVYSLPVAPLALPKCSSVFDVHTRPRATWTTGAVTQNFYGFCFPWHRSSTVLQPFLTPFFLPLCRRFRTAHRVTQTERKLYFDAYCTLYMYMCTYNVYELC